MSTLPTVCRRKNGISKAMIICGVRMRSGQLVVLVSVLVLVLLLVHRNAKRSCQGPEYLQAMCAKQQDHALPTIYAVTPTYKRPTQKAELTRLSHIFMLVPNLHWLLVEDSNTTTPLVRNLLERAGLQERVTHLHIITPPAIAPEDNNTEGQMLRSTVQRNLALAWIRANVAPASHSVVFFMDEERTYSLELFEEMAKIEPSRAGIWPVGLADGLMVEKPTLSATRNSVKSYGSIDMAAFAISTDLLFRHPRVQFEYPVNFLHGESHILQHLIKQRQLQPLANRCRNVLVWHTSTEEPILDEEQALNEYGQHSDVDTEV